jgi:hypothetical protein
LPDLLLPLFGYNSVNNPLLHLDRHRHIPLSPFSYFW